MRKFSLIIISTFIINSLSAQQNNYLKFFGFGYDNLIRGVGFGDELEKYNWFLTLGYERTIGSRVALGINLGYLYGVEFQEFRSEYTPKVIPGYSHVSSSYSSHGFAFGYESKFFLHDFEMEDDDAGAYLGFNYQFININERLEDTRYSLNSNTNQSLFEAFPENQFKIHRYGVKLGVIFQGLIFKNELSLGGYLNFNTRNNNQPWANAINIAPISFNISYCWGLPF
jgi:hypothetical protein